MIMQRQDEFLIWLQNLSTIAKLGQTAGDPTKRALGRVVGSIWRDTAGGYAKGCEAEYMVELANINSVSGRGE
jgi:hypothetical protein